MASGGRIEDSALVVRCGVPPFGNPTTIWMKRVHHGGVFGFSVQSASGVPFERLASECLNNRVGVLTVAEIRHMGYDVVTTPGQGWHATVSVPEDWDLESAGILAAKFRNEMNPSPKARR